MAWLLAAFAVVGYFTGAPGTAPFAVVILALLITGQTVGVDRVERDFDAR